MNKNKKYKIIEKNIIKDIILKRKLAIKEYN